MPRAKRKRKGGADVPAVLGVLFAPTSTIQQVPQRATVTLQVPIAPAPPSRVPAQAQGVSTQRIAPTPSRVPALSPGAQRARTLAPAQGVRQPEITPTSLIGSPQHPSSPLPSPEITYGIDSDELFNEYKQFVLSLKEIQVPKPIKKGIFYKTVTNQLDIDIVNKINEYYQLQKDLFMYEKHLENNRSFDYLKKFLEFDISDVYESLPNDKISSAKTRIYSYLYDRYEINEQKPVITSEFYEAFVSLDNIAEYTKKEPENSALIKNLIVLFVHIKNKLILYQVDILSKSEILHNQARIYILLSTEIYSLLSLCLLNPKRFTIKENKRYDICNMSQLKQSNLTFITQLKQLISNNKKGGKKKSRRPRKPKQR